LRQVQRVSSIWQKLAAVQGAGQTVRQIGAWSMPMDVG